MRMPVPFSPTNRYQGCGSNPCLLCGREVRPGSGGEVEMSTSLELIADEPDAPDSQGCFPVGPECIKRVPEPFRLK